jgi:cytochrome b subunit of formate dehydrogenase
MRSVSMVLAAAGDSWLPKSDLFQLNFRMASVMLLVAAGGIALGLFATALFRYRRVRLNIKTAVVRRHTAGHMLMHWLNAAGFLLALFTGAIMLKWLPVPMGKVALYTLHYIGAGLVLIGLVATVVNAVSKGTTSVHRLIPSRQHIRQAFLEVLGYAGLLGDRGILGFRALQWPVAWRREMAKAVGFSGFGRDGKYLAAEEVLSYPLWALVGLAIVSTGILKAARFVYPLPLPAVKWLTIVHDWAAVGTVVMLFAHVGALVLVRTNWPLFASMFTGKVRAAYVKENHGEWYEELVAEVEQGKPAERNKGAAT